MNDLEKYILSKGDSQVSSEELKAMGRRATAKYLEDNVPLNESIKGMAKEANLNHEQVKRVVEFANNDTFVTIFKNGFGKNITFPMADSSAVMQTINAPEMNKTAAREVITSKYIPGQERASLEEAFGSTGFKEKVASVNKSQVKLDYLASKNNLDDLRASKELLGTAFLLKLAELTTLCKQASAEGYSPEVIGASIDKARPSKGLQTVFKESFGDLVEFGSLHKVATGGYMIPENPITGLTQDLEGVSQKLVATQQAVQKTQASMTELLSILKSPEQMPSPGSELFQPSPAPMAPTQPQMPATPAPQNTQQPTG